MSGSILPNTFQTPNDYIDEALELLTAEEFKCLMFAARHILGWQDRIEERRTHISISMFQNGFDSEKGHHFGGVGLGRAAIVRAIGGLIGFKFFIKEDLTSKGQSFQLGGHPDWDGLKKRETDRHEAGRKNTEKARTNRSSEVVSQTNQRLVEQTETGLLDRLNQRQDQTQREKDIATDETVADETRSPDDNSAPPPKVLNPEKPKRVNPAEPQFRQLAQAFRIDPDVLMNPQKTKTAMSTPYWKAANELRAIAFPVERTPELYKYIERRKEREGWKSFTVNALSKYALEFLRDVKAPTSGQSSTGHTQNQQEWLDATRGMVWEEPNPVPLAKRILMAQQAAALTTTAPAQVEVNVDAF